MKKKIVFFDRLELKLISRYYYLYQNIKMKININFILFIYLHTKNYFLSNKQIKISNKINIHQTIINLFIY